MPFEIPFGFATTFKSDEDWLDEWEELEDKPRTRKPYTFDDRVDDYRYTYKVYLHIGLCCYQFDRKRTHNMS